MPPFDRQGKRCAWAVHFAHALKSHTLLGIVSNTGGMVNDAELAAEREAYRAQVRRDFRWNFGVMVMDGAMFFLGINIAASSTIMPLYVRHFTDSAVLIGLVSTIAGSGWYLPQLLTVNYIERLPRKKVVAVNIGLFAERIPFLVMAASALLLATRAPGLALTLFFVTLAWHVVGAGAIAVAWQEMLAKVIPVNYRGRMLATASFIGTATGVLGASVAASILDRYPFPTGFGICFGLTFVFVMGSWFFLSLTREPPLHSSKPPISLAEYWRGLPLILRQNHNFRAYLLARMATVLGRMGLGFLTVYAVERWGLGDSQAGFYTTVLLIGQALSNLVFGPLADRAGHKLVLEASLTLVILSMIAAILAPSPVWMYPVFAAVGAITASDVISGVNIALEFGDPAERPTYIGLANTVPGLTAAIAPLIGGWIASRASYQATFLSAAVCSLVALAFLHWMVVEPRKLRTGGGESDPA
jgi:MFS family permease